VIARQTGRCTPCRRPLLSMHPSASDFECIRLITPTDSGSGVACDARGSGGRRDHFCDMPTFRQVEVPSGNQWTLARLSVPIPNAAIVYTNAGTSANRINSRLRRRALPDDCQSQLSVFTSAGTSSLPSRPGTRQIFGEVVGWSRVVPENLQNSLR